MPLPLPPPPDPAEGVAPVQSVDDVLAVYPASLKTSDPAPVRDALLGALAAILMRHQERAEYAVAQADRGRATGSYLDAAMGDQGVHRVRGELDEPYRARGLSVPDQVTRDAIVAAVEGVLADLAPGRARYYESILDRFFVSDGTADWHSFIGESPQYPDRLYPDDADSNGGESLPQSDPGGARVFDDTVGRHFVIRVPDLGGLDQSLTLVYAGVVLDAGDAAVPELGGATPPFAGTLEPGEISPSEGGTGFFVADGTNDSGSEADGTLASFVFQNTTDALTTYQAIVGAVERIRGQSIRWTLEVDPTL